MFEAYAELGKQKQWTAEEAEAESVATTSAGQSTPRRTAADALALRHCTSSVPHVSRTSKLPKQCLSRPVSSFGSNDASCMPPLVWQGHPLSPASCASRRGRPPGRLAGNGVFCAARSRGRGSCFQCRGCNQEPLCCTETGGGVVSERSGPATDHALRLRRCVLRAAAKAKAARSR